MSDSGLLSDTVKLEMAIKGLQGVHKSLRERLRDVPEVEGEVTVCGCGCDMVVRLVCEQCRGSLADDLDRAQLKIATELDARRKTLASLHQTECDLAAARRECENQRTHYENVSSQLNEARNRIKQLEERLNPSEGQYWFKRLSSEVIDLKAEVLSLKKELADERGLREFAVWRQNDPGPEIKRLREELSRVGNMYKTALEEADLLRSERDKKDREQVELYRRIDDLETEGNALRVELRDAKRLLHQVCELAERAGEL